MTNRLFNCISIILHPIFTLTLGMVIIISVLLPGSLVSQWMILAFCALYSVVMPMAFIGFARILGYVDDLRMRNKRSRIFALVVCAISILAFGHLLKNWHAPSVMQMFVTGVVVTLLIAALLAFFTRISLHTIGWGGLTAVVSFLSFASLLLVTVESGREHLGVVEHKHILVIEIIDDIFKDAVLKLPRFAVDNQQARFVAVFRRVKCDAFLGQIVIKLRKFHSKKFLLF